jgi:hypothetical protein
MVRFMVRVGLEVGVMAMVRTGGVIRAGVGSLGVRVEVRVR